MKENKTIRFIPILMIPCLAACLFSSCEEGEEELAQNSVELISDSVYLASYLPEDYDLTYWYDYFEENNEFPQEEGQVLTYSVTVMTRDTEGHPLPGASIHFSVDGGALTSTSITTDTEGRATVIWTFDGTWETWGNFSLTIEAFDTDGETMLEGSPLTVKSIIDAPPGV